MGGQVEEVGAKVRQKKGKWRGFDAPVRCLRIWLLGRKDVMAHSVVLCLEVENKIINKSF